MLVLSHLGAGVTFLRRFLLFFVPYANHDIPTGLVIYIFSFRAYWYASFSYGFVISKTASRPAQTNRFVYASRICTISTSSFWWNFCKSCMCYGFLYFVRFPPLIAIVFIFYLLVIFPSQTRIRVNIKVVRCLKYSASLVSTQSVLTRNSDNKWRVYMILVKTDVTSS